MYARIWPARSAGLDRADFAEICGDQLLPIIREAKVPPCPAPISSGGGPDFFPAPRPLRAPKARLAQLHPDVAPQVLHFMQVPLRTSV